MIGFTLFIDSLIKSMERTTINAVKSIAKAIRATHTVEQVKAYYHYRGLELITPAIQMSVRQAVGPDWELNKPEDIDNLLEVMLLKLFQLGQQDGISQTIDYLKSTPIVQSIHSPVLDILPHLKRGGFPN